MILAAESAIAKPFLYRVRPDASRSSHLNPSRSLHLFHLVSQLPLQELRPLHPRRTATTCMQRPMRESNEQRPPPRTGRRTTHRSRAENTKATCRKQHYERASSMSPHGLASLRSLFLVRLRRRYSDTFEARAQKMIARNTTCSIATFAFPFPHRNVGSFAFPHYVAATTPAIYSRSVQQPHESTTVLYRSEAIYRRHRDVVGIITQSLSLCRLPIPMPRYSPIPNTHAFTEALKHEPCTNQLTRPPGSSPRSLDVPIRKTVVMTPTITNNSSMCPPTLVALYHRHPLVPSHRSQPYITVATPTLESIVHSRPRTG